MARVVVLGAGVIGLTTATQIQEALPSAHITVIAECWDLETTTAGAGGLFRTWAKSADHGPASKLRTYAADSARYWREKARTAEAVDMGIMPISLHEVFTLKPEREMFLDYCVSFREMPPEQVTEFGSQYTYGYTVDTWVISPPIFLRYLRNLFTSRGGMCERRKINSLDELSMLDVDLVVNCTGLGSRWLFNDKRIHAVRGELLQMDAPWIKNAIFADAAMKAYLIPQPGYVIVGGTRENDDYDTTPRPDLGDQILERTSKLYPPIKKGRILKRWAGLRPMRDEIRLESELITTNGRTLKVVHNYGHGAVGVCISWECAQHATRLVLQQLGVASKL